MKNSVNKALLDGRECEVHYTFNDNYTLESGVYLFTRQYSNPQFYLEDFSKFKMMLCSKYGQPSSEKETWKKKDARKEIQHYGQAVAQGLLSIDAVWTTACSNIRIILQNGTGKYPVLKIHYNSTLL